MAHPERFAALKATIAGSYPDFERNATRSWAEILGELEKVTQAIKAEGSDYIPTVNFSDIDKLSPEQVAEIKRKGSVVIKDIVPDEQAAQWKERLRAFVQENPDVEATSLSETGPTEGTLRVFPDVLLSNAYIILRPFFTPIVPSDSSDIFKPESWKFDTSDPHFPGIHALHGGYIGPRPTPELHPNLRLETSIVSIPKVNPGDAVFWHCDVVHAVEPDHTGKGESAVMYIPAVPLTPQNLAYVERQKDAFLAGRCPPDFPQGVGEAECKGVASAADILSEEGRRAMGFTIPTN